MDLSHWNNAWVPPAQAANGSSLRRENVTLTSGKPNGEALYKKRSLICFTPRMATDTSSYLKMEDKKT